MTLTHFKNKNQTIEMVDISKKKKTARIAVAESLIKIDKTLYQVLLKDQNLFSNLCATAKIAGPYTLGRRATLWVSTVT